MSRSPRFLLLLSLLFVSGAVGWLRLGVSQERGTDPAAAPARRTVRDFGAVGDGVADDTAAVRRAIGAGLGVVRFPPGRYRLTSTIEVALDALGPTALVGEGGATLVMAGAGPAVRLAGTHFKSADPEGFAPGIWERERMPMVDGLAITGEHAEADGIEAIGTMQLTVTRVHLRKLRHGIRLARNNRNVLIADSHIYENNGVGVYYDDVNLHQSNITGCHISYNGGGGVVSRGGNVRNLHITGCDLESNMRPDLPATANVLIDCSTSDYGTGEVAITGCTIQHNSPSPDSANIRILGQSRPSATQPLVREGHVTITGNVLSDVQVNVHLRGCRGVVLTGNTFWMGYQHNLLVEDCAHVVVGPNNFDRNPRYDYGTARTTRNTLLFRGCEDCTLQGLHVAHVDGGEQAPAAVTLDQCRRMHVSACTILDCGPIGLLLQGTRDSLVSDCLIRDDREGASSTPLADRDGGGNTLRP